jgi:ABC-type bacteriocin/lantibiotic exporter with double-glycine peptidase domain
LRWREHLIRDAQIILLDEATYSLDSESEREVQLAIGELRKGRTCLAVAHRLHTISAANRIYVIEDGTVTESGGQPPVQSLADTPKLSRKARGTGDIPGLGDL